MYTALEQELDRRCICDICDEELDESQGDRFYLVQSPVDYIVPVTVWCNIDIAHNVWFDPNDIELCEGHILIRELH